MLPSLPPTPKIQERSAEMSPHHCTLRKLYRMPKTAAAAWAKPPRSTTSPLLSAIRSDHIIPNPLAGRTESVEQKVAKEAQQETQIAVNSFKWFNVYLVPEIRH